MNKSSSVKLCSEPKYRTTLLRVELVQLKKRQTKSSFTTVAEKTKRVENWREVTLQNARLFSSASDSRHCYTSCQKKRSHIANATKAYKFHNGMKMLIKGEGNTIVKDYSSPCSQGSIPGPLLWNFLCN